MWEERKGILKDLHLLQIMSFILKISKFEEFIKRQYLKKIKLHDFTWSFEKNVSVILSLVFSFKGLKCVWNL